MVEGMTQKKSKFGSRQAPNSELGLVVSWESARDGGWVRSL